MKGFRFVVLLCMVWLVSAGANGQALSSVPDDALIVPIGVAGTAYETMQLGQQGGVLRIAVYSNPKAWNAHTAHETSTTRFTGGMHRGLLSFNHRSAAIALDVAKGYEVSDDGLVITFTLREGISWSDGHPITADDVVFTYNDVILNRDVDCNARDVQRLPDGSYPVCQKIGEHAVSFTLSCSYRPILNALVFPLLPRHVLAHRLHKLNPRVPAGTFNETWTLDTPVSELVGNGPWMVEEFQPGVFVRLKRNPYYYGYDPAGTQLPYYDEILAIIVGNQDVAMLKFLNNEIDVYNPRAEDIPILLSEAATSDFTIITTSQLRYGTNWILINQDIGLSDGTQAEKRALYRDVRFREAIARLMDKSTAIRNVLNGLGAPQWSPISAPSPFYAGRDGYGGPITEARAVVFEYDPSLAAALLDDLSLIDQDGDGWRDLPSGAPLAIEINTGSNTVITHMCLILIEDLRKAGLNAVFQRVEFNTLVNRIFAASGDIIALGLTGGDEPNESKNVYTSCGSLHAFRYSACREPTDVDLRIDELYDLGASTFDLDEAFAYYQELQELVAGQLGYIYSVIGTFSTAYSNRVGNAHAASPVSLPEAYLAELCFEAHR